MMYRLDYSYPKQADGSDAAVSNWTEGTMRIEAPTNKEAQSRAIRTLEKLGTWMVLDCYPIGA